MKEIVTYLTFDGNAREAMTRYQQVLGGELHVMTGGESGHCPEVDKDKVMHAKLALGKATLMASDAMSMTPGKVEQGNNFSISLDCESIDEEQRFFDGLAEGGTVMMPLQDTFWGARFGMVTDRFGIQWMFNYDKPQA